MQLVSQNSLNRIESICKVLGFKIRYEKGNFKTGSCFIMHSKVIVINKFVSLDQKITSLIDILLSQQIDEQLLDERQRELVGLLRQTKLNI